LLVPTLDFGACLVSDLQRRKCHVYAFQDGCYRDTHRNAPATNEAINIAMIHSSAIATRHGTHEVFEVRIGLGIGWQSNTLVASECHALLDGADLLECR